MTIAASGLEMRKNLRNMLRSLRGTRPAGATREYFVDRRFRRAGSGFRVLVENGLQLQFASVFELLGNHIDPGLALVPGALVSFFDSLCFEACFFADWKP